MARQRFTLLIITLGMSMVSPTLWAQSRSAGCVLKVQIDPDVLPWNENTLEGILYSSGVAGKALTAATMETPEAYLQASYSITTGYRNMAVIRLKVDLPASDPPQADAVLGSVTDRLRDVLSGVQNDYLATTKKQLASLEDEYRDLTDGADTEQGGRPEGDAWQGIQVSLDCHPQTPVGELVGALRDAVSPDVKMVVLWSDLDESVGVDPEDPVGLDAVDGIRFKTALDLLLRSVDPSGKVSYGVTDNVLTIATKPTLEALDMGETDVDSNLSLDDLTERQNRLTNEVLDREQEVAGGHARQQALETQIAELDQQVARDVDHDPVIRELQKIFQIQTDRYENLKKLLDSGRASAEDWAKMQETLSETRIRMAKQRAETAQQKGAERLIKLRGQLQDLTLELSESEARLRFCLQQIQTLRATRQQAARLDEQQARQRLREESRHNLTERIEDLKNQLRSLQPMVVTVIGR